MPLDTATAVDFNQLAIRLAPIVCFHSKEQFGPCSVEWLLSRCSLTQHQGDLTWALPGKIYLPSSMSITKPGPVTPVDLRAATNAAPGGARNEDVGLWPMEAAPGQSASYSHPSSDSWYFSDYQLDTLTGELAPTASPTDMSGAACYAHVVDVTGYILINYYFLCAYNGAMGPTTTWTAPPLAAVTDGGGFEQHVGDWMRIGARATGENGLYTLQGVEFDAHGETRYVTDPPFSFTNLSLDQVSNLTIYSAWHSHETYPSAGTWPLPHAPGNDYTDAEGLHWHTQSTLVFEGSDDGWVVYNGNFGNNVHYGLPNVVDTLTTASCGPAFKSDWTRGPDYPPPAQAGA